MSESDKDLSKIVEEQNDLVLKQESLDILSRVLAEQDQEKVKDLTYLFNLNQNKKNMARNIKLNEVLDIITRQAFDRFSAHPEEISNKELLDAVKVIQDSIEKTQKAISGIPEIPIIQINNQTNEVNLRTGDTLDRAARERVKNAVMSILAGIQNSSDLAHDITEDTEITENEVNDNNVD